MTPQGCPRGSAALARVAAWAGSSSVPTAAGAVAQRSLHWELCVLRDISSTVGQQELSPVSPLGGHCFLRAKVALSGVTMCLPWVTAERIRDWNWVIFKVLPNPNRGGIQALPSLEVTPW